MTRPTALMALLVTLSACSGKDMGPTSPGTGALSGSVLAGRLVIPASVTIMDGIHAGQSRTTDEIGRYSFADLTLSAFTLRATAAGYGAQNKAVNLTTANQLVNFDLSDH